MVVNWSKHARLRLAERIGRDVEVPIALMQAIAARKQPGEDFIVGQFGVLFICVRDGEAIVIKTVLDQKQKRDAVNRTTKNKKIRQKADRRERQSRADGKRELERLSGTDVSAETGAH